MPSKKDIIIFYLLSFTWGIVMTLVGLFALLYIYLFMHKSVDIFMVAGRVCIRHKTKIFGGISLGIVYYIDKRNSYRLHTHELGHTVQNVMFGLLFPVLIGIPSVIRANLRRKFPSLRYDRHKRYIEYDSIWFEGQATELGEKYFHETVTKLLGEWPNAKC